MTDAALALDTQDNRHLQTELVKDHATLKEALALRFKVFSEECGASLPNADSGLDQDSFDLHCEHLSLIHI